MMKNRNPFHRHLTREADDATGWGRGHRGPGRGHGLRGMFGRGRGGDMPAGGRKFSSEDLQLLLLALLARQSAHGYELIRQIEEVSGGFYTPSPGMVYPALTYLGEIGHASFEADGNRKLYIITEEGRAALAEKQAHADTILSTLKRIATRMSEVRDAFAGVDGADPQTADELHLARRALKEALMSKRGCSSDEGRRIAKILQDATAAIHAVTP